MTTSTKAALEPHELSKLFPPISEEDFNKLAGDIKLHGLHQPIVCYQGKILDGNNRYRACELAGVKPTFADFEGDDAKARNFVISANIHRRHLSPEQRREIIATLLKNDSTQSNRQIADTANADHKTVGTVRAELEAGGEIPHQEETVGKDGVAQTTKTKRGGKGKGTTTTKSDKVTIEYKKPTDTKSVISACRVHTTHLQDLLGDLSVFSSVDHAEVLAGQIKDWIDRKIRGLKPAQDEEETEEPEMADAAE